MTQFKKAISLKKIVRGFLGKDKSEKYLKGTEALFKTSGSTSTMDLYQHALSQFMEGNTEPAINCIILILDSDREHKLTLHLCKTMLYGLTQYMSETSQEIGPIKKKYDYNLETGVVKIKKKVKDLEKIISGFEDDLEKTEKEMIKKKSNPIFFLFQKNKYKSKVQEIKTTISNKENELDSAKSELNKIDEYLQREEQLKIVGIIVEVCIFPSRFESENSRSLK